MGEAQKMMNDPAFQAQMKKLTESQGFKQHMEASQEMMKDPEKMKEIEAKMQDRLKEGNEMLSKYKEQEKEKSKKENEEGEEDGDKKVAAKEEETEEGEDIPDIPSLNLN